MDTEFLTGGIIKKAGIIILMSNNIDFIFIRRDKDFIQIHGGNNKYVCHGIWKMVQQLRELVALPDQTCVQFPVMQHGSSQLPATPVLGDLMSFHSHYGQRTQL